MIITKHVKKRLLFHARFVRIPWRITNDARFPIFLPGVAQHDYVKRDGQGKKTGPEENPVAKRDGVLNKFILEEYKWQ